MEDALRKSAETNGVTLEREVLEELVSLIMEECRCNDEGLLQVGCHIISKCKDIYFPENTLDAYHNLIGFVLDIFTFFTSLFMIRFELFSFVETKILNFVTLL